jgi:hypothetical protein
MIAGIADTHAALWYLFGDPNHVLHEALLRALDDLSGRGVVLEFTVYSLCPYDDEDGQDEETVRRHEADLLDRASLMSPAQIQAIRSFLLFVKENADDRRDLRPYLARALENVWR